ncbi:MAG: DNA mismatch repair protein MutL [Chloroflexi bacterium HGW-Chloroflexi-8]|jgi:DNA mismatch repair protein MutL|nr:MAG: DNA mismatch repair protein MutL [Chloroflexi bacterium HGW-Chloroflexi-8]
MEATKRKIDVLKEEVASQIAAGEVIERPSSVVKELAENSIDAGATEINILISEAGKKLIEIADNGSGIPFEEIRLAVTRHATSKIVSSEELFSIKTLGFRGEALASIASVSQFEIVTREKNDELGGKLVIEGGREVTQEKIGVPVGTRIRVKNLFFNVPARLKFLKSDSNEKQKISALVMRYSLAYPFIRFKLIIDDREIFHSNGNGDRREILIQFYGLETARKMLEVRMEEDGYLLSGFISPIAITKSNRRDITFFINGRWVQDISLSSALIKAYQTMIMVGRYPIANIFLDIPAQQVDVNVHPTKAEVRFQRPDYLFSLVQRATRRALLAYNPVPELTPKSWSNDLDHNSQAEISWTPVAFIDQATYEDGEETPNPESDNSQSTQGKSQNQSYTNPLLKLVGQIGAMYIVAEGPDGLYLIDQHAAHERILFEKLMKQFSHSIPSQSLLSPEVITLPPNQAILLLERMKVLNSLGFDVNEFGSNSFQIRSIPSMLLGLNPESAIRVVVDDFEDDETPLQNKIEQIIAARVCKRAAVKAGQILTKVEQEILLRDLESCDSPRTCPHGRPTMIHLSVELLEKQFGRKGSL